jgi:hypothetical protein
VTPKTTVGQGPGRTVSQPPSRTAGQGPAARNPGAAPQVTGRNNANRKGILRNPTFASLPTRSPTTRTLARSTFRGRFAQSSFARDFDRRHHHRNFGIVLGFVGPLFWPYAYDDFVDYTFWPYAYDTFWPYAFDDVYEGIYGGYAPEYDQDALGAYAYAGAPASTAAYGRRSTIATLPGGGSQVCTGQAQGLTDFPIQRISQQVQPNQDQQALLDDLKAATAKAVGILQAACPTGLASTPTGRLAAMRQRVTAMLQAVQVIRPALDKFYQSLSDEQKERFNSLDQTAQASGRQSNVAQLCSSSQPQVAGLPSQRIRRSIRLSDAQSSALDALDRASAQAADVLKMSCPSGQQALTPTGRLAAMQQRLGAMQQALDTVQPALAKFYGSLSDEQKARVDRLGARPT